MILIRTPDILQFGWRMDRRPLKQNYKESLAMSLLEILCSLCSSCSSCSWCVLCVLGAFFVFEGLWWKFFGALEAWIRRAPLIYGLLRFLEAFELDSSKLQDLDWRLGWFYFECSLHLSLKILKFLKALRFDPCRVFVLLSASESSLMLLML